MEALQTEVEEAEEVAPYLLKRMILSSNDLLRSARLQVVALGGVALRPAVRVAVAEVLA